MNNATRRHGRTWMIGVLALWLVCVHAPAYGDVILREPPRRHGGTQVETVPDRETLDRELGAIPDTLTEASRAVQRLSVLDAAMYEAQQDGDVERLERLGAEYMVELQRLDRYTRYLLRKQDAPVLARHFLQGLETTLSQMQGRFAATREQMSLLSANSDDPLVRMRRAHLARVEERQAEVLERYRTSVQGFRAFLSGPLRLPELTRHFASMVDIYKSLFSAQLDLAQISETMRSIPGAPEDIPPAWDPASWDIVPAATGDRPTQSGYDPAAIRDYRVAR